jgi:hypothetical protein
MKLLHLLIAILMFGTPAFAAPPGPNPLNSILALPVPKVPKLDLTPAAPPPKLPPVKNTIGELLKGQTAGSYNPGEAELEYGQANAGRYAPPVEVNPLDGIPDFALGPKP